MIYELNHYNVVVKDLEKSMAFYQDYLGGKVVFRGSVRRVGTPGVIGLCNLNWPCKD